MKSYLIWLSPEAWAVLTLGYTMDLAFCWVQGVERTMGGLGWELEGVLRARGTLRVSGSVPRLRFSVLFLGEVQGWNVLF